MKRRVGKVAVFLLLGAIINVAVAWAFALRVPPAPMTTGGMTMYVQQYRTCQRQLGGGNHWFVNQLARTSGTSQFTSWITGHEVFGDMSPDDPMDFVESWSRIRAPVLPDDSAIRLRQIGNMRAIVGPSQLVIDHAYGWPFRCMWCGWGSPEIFEYTALPN